MEQSPEASLVQVRFVAVSSAPCGAAPSTGALSVNNVNTAPDSGAAASSCLWMFTVPQFVMLTGMGAMKSFNSEVNELPEERLFRVTAPKCWHVVVENIPEPVRLIPASPKVELMPFFVFPSRVRGAPGGLVSITGARFTAASAKAPKLTALFQHGRVLLASQLAALPLVIHVCLASTGTPLPLKSKSINRSPAVRTGVTPLALGVEDWLSSKSIWAEPSRLERSQARYR